MLPDRLQRARSIVSHIITSHRAAAARNGAAAHHERAMDQVTEEEMNNGVDLKIEWAHHTFNPWSGCEKVSAGCANCYAAALPPGMRRGAEWGKDRPRGPASDAYWRQPVAWDRAAAKAGERHRVFCASTADVFEAREDLDPWRDRLMALIALTPNLDWLLLTKRPEYAGSYLAAPGLYHRILDAAPFFRLGTRRRDGIARSNDRSLIGISDPTDLAVWWPNLWIGTSVEDQAAADERIFHLLRIPARVRFLSMEPLLGPVRLDSVLTSVKDHGYDPHPIAWVIVGGESGRRARPMHPDWARALKDQCVAAGVPFFFKQWGEWAPEQAGNDWTGMYEFDPRDGGAPRHYWADSPYRRLARDVAGRQPGEVGGDTCVLRVGKVAAGRVLDGRTWDQVPR